MSSNNVDNRVVNMQFNNAQFEAGVKQTIASLDSLKQALKMNTAVSGINTIQSAVNSFSLANIEESVERLSQRFSTLGIVGMTAISNLANKAVNKVTGALGQAYNTIVTGGWGRASRSAQARFTLEGILGKDEEGLKKVNEAFESARKSVDGTAYTLDSAVSIAAKLATSGIDTGEALEGALLGLAGVAATTGANYEMLGDVWGDAASMGKATNDTLSRLEMQGLPAAKTLADAMGKTTEEIRKMASQGEISFEQFAEVMTDKFGKHAKDANSTFQGVTANIRAQLTKIGEIFSSGIIENKEFIEFLDNFRKKLGEVKTAIAKLQDTFKNLVTAGAKLAKNLMDKLNLSGLDTFIDNVKWGMEQLTNYINSFLGVVDEISETSVVQAAKDVQEATSGILQVTEAQAQMAWDIWNLGKYGNGAARMKALGDDYEYVQAYVNALKAANFDLEKVNIKVGDTAVKAMEETATATEEAGQEAEEATNKFEIMAGIIEGIKLFASGVSTVFNSIKMVVGKLWTAFKKVFSWTDLLETIGAFGLQFKQWAGYFEVNEERAEKFERIFQGLFSAINLVRKIFIALTSAFTNIFGPAASGVFDILLSIFATIGDGITKIDEWTEKNTLLSDGFTRVGDVISSAISTIKEFFSRLVQLPAVQKIKEALSGLASTIGDKLLVHFKEAKDAVEKFFGKLEEGSSDKMDEVLNNINTALENMLDLMSKSKENIGKFFGWFDDTEATLEEAGVNVDSVSNSVTTLKKNAETLAASSSLGDFANNLSSVFPKTGEKVAGFGKTILEWLKNLDYAKIGLIGFAGTLSAFLASAAYFNFNLSTMVATFKQFPLTIVSTISSIKTAIKGLGDQFKNQGRAKLVKAFAIAIAVLAASLIAMTFVDADKLRQASISLSILVGVMTLAISVLTVIANRSKNIEATNKNLISMGIAFVAIAGAAFLLALALVQLTEIKMDKNIIKPLGVLIVILAALVGCAIALSKFAPTLSEGGLLLVFYAAAVWILVKALQSLANLDTAGLQERMLALAEALGIIAGVGFLMGFSNFGGTLGVLVLVMAIFTVERALQYIIKNGISMDDIRAHLDKFYTILLALGVIAVYMGVLGAICRHTQSLGMTILLTAIGIYVIVKALEGLSKISANPGSAAFVTAMLLEMLLMVLVIAAMKKPLQGASKTLISMAIAIGIIGLVAALLGSLPDRKKVWGGVRVVTALVALMSAMIFITVFAKNLDYKMLYAMIAAIAALAFIVALLSFIPDQSKLVGPVIAMTVLILALGGAMMMMTAFADKIDDKNGSKFLKAMYAMIIMLIIVIAGLAMLVVASGGNWESVVFSAIAICGVLATMAAAFALLFKSFNKYGNPTKTQRQAIALMIATIMAIAASLSALTYVIGPEGNWKPIALAVAAIGAVLIAIVVMLVAVKKYLKSGLSSTVRATIIEMIVMIGVIALSLSLILLAMGENDYSKVMGVAGAIALVLGTLAFTFVLMSSLSKGLSVPTVVAIGLMILAIVAIAYSIKALMEADVDWDKADKVVFGLITILGTLILAITIMAIISQIFSAGVILAVIAIVAVLVAIAATIKPIATGVNMFVDVINRLSEINWGGIDIVKLLELVGVLSLFGVAAVIAGAGLAVVGVALIIVAAAAMGFASAIFLISTGAASILSSLSGIAMAIALLGTTMETSSSSIKDGLAEIGTGLANALVNFLKNLAANAKNIRESLHTVIVEIGALVTDFIDTLIITIVDGLIQLLTTIEEKGPILAEKSLKVLMLVLKTIAEHAGALGFVGAYLIVAFLNGVIKGLNAMIPDLLNSLAAMAVVLVAGFANAVYENEEALVDAFYMLGLVLMRTIIDCFNLGGIFDSSLESIDGEIEYQRSKIEEAGYLAGGDYTVAMGEGIQNGSTDLAKTNENAIGEATDGTKVAAENGEKAGASLTASLEDYVSKNNGDISIDGLINTDGAAEIGKMFGFDVGTEASKSAEQAFDITGIPESALHQMESQGFTLGEAGKAVAKKMQEGAEEESENFSMESFLDNYGDGNSELLNMADTTAEEMGPKGEDVGSNYGEGIYNGMESWMGQIKEKATEIGDTMYDATKEATDENSPSKKGFEIGKFWDLGIANGISTFADRVAETSTTMANGLLSSTAAMMSMVSDIINSNSNLQPVIAPVVDTSSIDMANTSVSALFGTSTLAANAALSVDNASENTLAAQVGLLAKKVNDLANTDYSKILEGVAINVDASTNVDGTALRRTSSQYTINQIDGQQRSYIRAIGGKA